MQNTEEQVLELSIQELELQKVLQYIAGKCTTEMGKEYTLALRPHEHRTLLQAELERVDECLTLHMRNEPVPFEALNDVRPLLRKSMIEGAFLSAPQLLEVFDALQSARQVKRFIEQRSEELPWLWDLVQDVADNRLLEKHITDAIDDTGLVRDNASRELQQIRRDIHQVSARLRSRLQKILKQYGEEELLQEDFITQREGRFVLPLRVGNKRAVNGVIHGMSASGNTVFLEPAETFEMNNELSILHGRENRELIKILTTLTIEVGAMASPLQHTVTTLTIIDSTIARATFAADHSAMKPIISADGGIELSKVRHPMLAITAAQSIPANASSVIPLSVMLTTTQRGLLISGPNAGGKTVAMKTIGISITMAMCGIFPLGACTTAMYKVFTAIGDHQSISSNLSTFSSQIIRLRDILSYCNANVLVLVDEICAGTDPAEGGALASGILDSLIERTALFVVTTHQSSLKQYALAKDNITNASLAFDEQNMQPTFHFLPNVPGNSYAFVLAKNVGLPDVVIERARGYMGDRHTELEESISIMQKYRQQAEDQALKASAEFGRAEKLRIDYEHRMSEVRLRKQTIIDEARGHAADVLQRSQSLVENTIREIREQQRSVQDVKTEYENEKQNLQREIAKAKVVDAAAVETAFENGMNVVVKGSTNVGSVIAVNHDNRHVVVDVNGIKFSLPFEQVEPTNKKPVSKSSPTSVSDRIVLSDSHTSCDIRGMRVHEALQKIEEFLDNAIVSGLHSVTVIHGKGTGALRKVVRDYAKDHHGVRSYADAHADSGGAGVTILEL
ncbi:MAG: endonuclease MutS2 [Ignavibacteria bacterium]|nr:endonuclease MutS2 [Ignavibacteria bacterium]